MIAQDAGRPNIVLVITDDMGHGDLGVTGATDIRTPNLDALARQGIRFTDFYSNGPLCTPTRAALISGRYQQRVAIEEAFGGATSAAFERGLPARGTSLPQLLRHAGYTTGLIGKWHLGYKPEFSPRAHGFDVFWGLKSGYVDYYHHTDGAGRPDLFDGDSATSADGYMTDLITERALRFVRDNRQRPFFLEVAYNAPHWPYQPPDKPSRAGRNGAHLDARSEDPPGTRADYAQMVQRVDAGIGELVRLLESQGLTRNTLVIFTNDNGGEWLSRNAPFRHRKWSLYEGGIRVPAIMKWPLRIPPARTSGQVGITMDLSATILSAAGVRVPDEARYEGIDLLPVATGRAAEQERTLFWRTRAGGLNQQAIRAGDWKLLVDGPHAFLFNVKTDPGELRDVAATRQDVARRLARELSGWQQSVDAGAHR